LTSRGGFIAPSWKVTKKTKNIFLAYHILSHPLGYDRVEHE